MAFAAPLLLLCATAARADSFFITIIDATFSATCIGGTGTCTEVVNGSVVYNDVTNEVSDASLALTGTLNASLDGIFNGSGTNPCTNSPNCLQPDLVYDPDAVFPHIPIEFSPSLSPVFGFDAPTPEPLEGGVDGSAFFVPILCGGDQPNCNTAGAFPGGADYSLTSGTYTSVEVSPEPGSVILLAAGGLMLGFVSRRRTRTGSSK